MDTIGVRELRADLAGAVRRATAGERTVITSHGRPVAQLVPPPGARERTVDQAVKGILEFRRGRRLGPGISLRELIDEGRR